MSLNHDDQTIINEVQNHYKDNDSPYYLAELGLFFRSSGLIVPSGVRFKDYLKSRFHGRLVVIQDEKNPARIAIALPEKESHVRQQLADAGLGITDDSTVNYARLPVALIAAFCKIPPLGSRVYFRVEKPFRYETRVDEPAGNYVEIDERFRPSALAGRSVHELSENDRQTIFESIGNWAEANSVDLRNLYFDRTSLSVGQPGTTSPNLGNALQRLIEAQEQDVKRRIRIPGDIAIKLMELP